MAKDPAFLFYSSDFLTGTMFMTNEQVGKYIRLLCAQHQIGHLTEQHMMNICGSYDEHIWSKFIKDDDGRFYNLRCDEEINKRKNYSESRRNNRKKGIKKRESEGEHMNNICKSYDKHMENENENINNNIINNNINNYNLYNNTNIPPKQNSLLDTTTMRFWTCENEEWCRSVEQRYAVPENWFKAYAKEWCDSKDLVGKLTFYNFSTTKKMMVDDFKTYLAQSLPDSKKQFLKDFRNNNKLTPAKL